VVALGGGVSRAQDPYEIQVYTPEVNAAHHFGIELHSNFVVGGHFESTPPELPSQHVLHETLEPSFGITRWWEVGAYLQGALRPDGRIDYAGVKLRTKVRFPIRDTFPIQLAVNVEVSWLPEAYEAAVWGTELRPVIEWRTGRLTVDFNPILGFEWTGTHAGVPHFEPALSVRYRVYDLFSLGLEYYGATGPLTNVDAPAAQVHYLFETVNLVAWRRWELQIGIGAGLTPASNALVAKSIIGYEL
jgi:hypothetical protein